MDKSYEFSTTEDVVIVARWTDSTGVPYDISSATLTVKQRASDVAALVTKTLVGGGITKTALTFWLTARIPAKVIAAGLYRYEFNVVRLVDNYQRNLLIGELEIEQGLS